MPTEPGRPAAPASRGSSFEVGVAAWQARLGLVRDHVRQELVARQLRDALATGFGEGSGPLRVVDVGCGQGTQAIELARAGHTVLGLDLSADLLEAARHAAEKEPPEVSARLRFDHGDLLAPHRGHLGAFDVACCHGVVMYVDPLDEAIAALGSLVRPGGLVSVLTRNRAGIAMRAAMTGRWNDAVEGFDARRYGNRVGVADVRADEPAEVAAAFQRAGIEVTRWHGVRLFTDHWGDDAPPDDVEVILAAEEEAGRRDPYRQLAALTHTIGLRR